MQTPLRITFRHMKPSAAVEARVHAHLERLERYHSRIIGCDVVIEVPPAHRRKGAPFEVRIKLSVPSGDICIGSERAARPTHTDVYTALHDAFDAAKRMLQDHAREHRGDVKRHSLQLH